MYLFFPKFFITEITKFTKNLLSFWNFDHFKFNIHNCQKFKSNKKTDIIINFWCTIMYDWHISYLCLYKLHRQDQIHVLEVINYLFSHLIVFWCVITLIYEIISMLIYLLLCKFNHWEGKSVFYFQMIKHIYKIMTNFNCIMRSL